ncbi:MAG TPA: radical SAM protein [Aquifex aeolicus]|uniref:Radical SAM protein n=1 Tax=Aquifex aeolicus TaxID=63363 RepID=A0A9D1CG80_AQUAO|nr:radical SAM protein [Aquifex aeolicus]
MQYVFGPVLSRRLGLSLGVDLLPPSKVCSMDCVYCECGKTQRQNLTLERREWVPTEVVKRELEEILSNPELELDFVTFSGNGEPTLHTRFGEIAKFVKEIRPDLKVALLTNASTLWMGEVLKELKYIDLVSPSLDAVTEKVFRKVNHPVKGLTVEKVLKGLKKLKETFGGEIWIETLFVKGINDSPGEVEKIGEWIHRLKPDRWQINTVVRPPAYRVQGLTEEELIQIARRVNYNPTDIVCYNYLRLEPKKKTEAEKVREKLLNLVKRRPSPLGELKRALNLTEEGFEELIETLLREGKVELVTYGGEKFLTSTQKGE